jgi:hypothetical protein
MGSHAVGDKGPIDAGRAATTEKKERSRRRRRRRREKKSSAIKPSGGLGRLSRVQNFIENQMIYGRGIQEPRKREGRE